MAKYNNSPIVRANLAAILAIARSDLPDAGSGIYPFMTAENTGIIHLFDPDSTTIGVLPTGSSSAGRWIAINRERLQANRTYFVRTDGNDNNDGLANTSGGAFLTIQKAIDVVASLDIGIYDVTIQVGNGTRTVTAPIELKSPLGAGQVIIQGDLATPSNVLFTSSVSGLSIFTNSSPLSNIKIAGVKIVSTAGLGIVIVKNSNLQLEAIDFGNCADRQVVVSKGFIEFTGSCTVSGDTGAFLYATDGGIIRIVNVTITAINTPNFGAIACVCAENSGGIIPNGSTFTGSATGKRYNCRVNGWINFSGNVNQFFGSIAGTTETGGQYA